MSKKHEESIPLVPVGRGGINDAEYVDVEKAALIPSAFSRDGPPWYLRALFLFFACILPLGSQDLYDGPSAMGPAFLDQYGITPFEIGKLYSAWALPNIFLVFFSGVFIDKIGANAASMIFNVIILVGSIVVFCSDRSYHTLLGGFVLYGIGAGSILVSQQTQVTTWFKGKELALSFGMTTVVLRLLSFMDYNLHPYLANRFGVSTALWVPLSVSLCAMGATVVCTLLDRHRKKKYPGPPAFNDPISFKQLRNLGKMFWILSFVCVTLSQCDLVFEMFAVNILTEDAYGVHIETAGRVVSLASLAIIVISPIITIIIDRYGHNAHFMLLASVLLVIAPTIVLAMPSTPESQRTGWACTACILFGLGYGIGVGVIWPSVGVLVNESITGTAFGILSGFLNIGFFAFPLLVGYLQAQKGNYVSSLIVILMLGIMSLIGTSVLMWLDTRYMSRLKKGTKGLAAEVADRARKFFEEEARATAAFKAKKAAALEQAATLAQPTAAADVDVSAGRVDDAAARGVGEGVRARGHSSSASDGGDLATAGAAVAADSSSSDLAADAPLIKQSARTPGERPN